MFFFFNNRENRETEPKLELDGQLLNYKYNTMFWGVFIYLLSWTGGDILKM